VGCTGRLDRVLDPRNLVWLECATDRQRGVDVPPRVSLDHHVDSRADSVTDCFDTGKAFGELSRLKIVTDGAHRRPTRRTRRELTHELRREAIPRPDLHAGDSAVQQFFRKLAGTFEPSLHVEMPARVDTGVVDANVIAN